MADAGAMQPVRRPLRVVRIKNENESVANVQRIMQGPTYQEKERRAATWNAAGCGSGLSESDMELVRDQSRPRPCGRKRKVAVPRPHGKNQLDFSIVSLAENVVFFPLYYKTLHPFSPR